MKIIAFVNGTEIRAVLSNGHRPICENYFSINEFEEVYNWAANVVKTRYVTVDVEWRNINGK